MEEYHKAFFFFFLYNCFTFQYFNKFAFLFLGNEEVLKFQGNDSVVDHFKLVLRDGNSLLIGAR